MYPKQFEIKRTFPRKVYLLLIALTLLTNISVQPYQLALQGQTFEPKLLPQLISSVLLNTLIYSVLAGLGLYLATRLGLGLPFIEGLYPSNVRRAKFRSLLILSIIAGVLVTLVVLGVDQLALKDLVLRDMVSQGMDLESQEIIIPDWWQTLLASFYGGISEEIQLRLFLLTLLAWLGSRIWRDKEGRPGLGVLWAATILSTIVFGLGHLPMLNAKLAAMGISMTPILIVSTLTTNGIGGIALGVLYWSRGLESAMIAHFTADITLHMITPIILSLFN
jgi:membrane protease YdiL (CAAX protease family)